MECQSPNVGVGEGEEEKPLEGVSRREKGFVRKGVVS